MVNADINMVITLFRLNWPKELTGFSSLIVPNDKKSFFYLDFLVLH